MNRKVGYLSFLFHKKLCKNIKNSRKSIYLKIGKNWNVFLVEAKIWKNFIFFVEKFFFSFFSNFQVIDFREFLIFLHNFLCKRKLRSHTLRFKSFLPPSLVFYPTFLALKFAQLSRSNSYIPNFWCEKSGVKN